MPCNCCDLARTYPAYAVANPACLYCGARIIQRIGRLQIPRDQIAARRRAMLAVWVEQGHSEAQIRELVKGVYCTGPAPVQACAPQTQTRRR